jgi:hypothetical protein
MRFLCIEMIKALRIKFLMKVGNLGYKFRTLRLKLKSY